MGTNALKAAQGSFSKWLKIVNAFQEDGLILDFLAPTSMPNTLIDY